MRATPEQMRRGRRLLADLLPTMRRQAKKEAEEGSLEVGSRLAQSMLPYITSEDYLDALLIYQNASGWFADLLFKGFPPYVPAAIGTPVSEPLASRDEATRMAKRLLLSVLKFVHENRDAPLPNAVKVFSLHGIDMRLEEGLFQAVLAQMPELAGHGYGSDSEARTRLDEIIATVLPNGVTEDALDALPNDDRARLTAVLHIAALSGVFRHPQIEATEPLGDSRH